MCLTLNSPCRIGENCPDLLCLVLLNDSATSAVNVSAVNAKLN